MIDETMIDGLVRLLEGRRVVVLSGAGCSTESGIPDYRGPKTREKARNPIQYRAFVTEPEARVRYWARSSVGWQRIAAAAPNAGHMALARLEAAGAVQGIITQNVDRLHHRAGSRRVVELHGALGEVCCLACGHREDRAAMQDRLLELNPSWATRIVGRATAGPGAGAGVEQAPDGDAEVEPGTAFRVPGCGTCGGVLKPDVVFFGENVPRDRVDAAWSLFEEGEVLLVVGSSLAVYSGYRFVLRAAKEGKPVALVNLGDTRGDHLAAVRLAAPTGKVLPALAEALL